ncbi:MAG: restriction endonuclease subunit S [Chitinophagaceae bacterium]|nr:MAG: restriction endonuclease subunit S [Chitinophagaceae bacterium]
MSDQELNRLMPELRFPEFRTSPFWNWLKGDDLFDQIANRSHNSDLPILAITQEYGAIPRELIDYHVSVTEKSVESYKVVEVGDFIISLRSFQGGIEFSKYKGLCSPAYVILRKKSSAAVNDFFKHYFKTAQFIKELNKNLEGLRDGKMISYKQFSELSLPKPSPAEQQKIAACFSSLDELIAAEVQKMEALKVHKKGLMRALFPVEGKTVPRVRFEGFAGEWEERTLAQVCNLKAGKFVSASEIMEEQTANSFPCYGGNGLRGFTRSYNHSGTYSLIGRQGALCGNVTFATGNFHATEHAVVVYPYDNIDTNWLYFVLVHLNLNQYATGQAQPGLSVDSLNQVELFVPPNKVEQQKIAASLSSLDETIAMQTQTIESLKLYKKGLMQSLFPETNSEK